MRTAVSKIKKVIGKVVIPTVAIWVLGARLSSGQALAACTADEVDTGLGCIAKDPTGIANFVVNLAFSTAAGVTFLLIAYGGFKVLTGSGDPKAVSEGKDVITSALTGLFLILFSVAILRIIGFNVLGIPFFKP